MLVNVLINIFCISFNFNKNPNIFLKREDFLTSNFALSILANNNNKSNKIDKFAHWSVYGLIPPPIEKTISIEELINEIKINNIIKIQQSINHNCVVVTNNKGHRWICLIKDKDIINSNKIIKEINSKLEILPIEKKYILIRNIWQIFFMGFISLFLFSELDMIEIDLLG